MSQPLVECVPNFSEGRRIEIVEQIEKSIAAVPGVYVLDRNMDADHNRSVITFVGPPESTAEAAFRATATAAKLIDLDHHQGAHPRIGATDVIPFVPLRDIAMAECVTLARDLGQRIANNLNIPVYLYEEAALRPDRRNLEDIRRGQYEGLKGEIQTNPDRFPDFGPHELGPAGATVVGARQALIAFNIYLSTDDVSVAKSIARAVRASSGGLRYVKAMGILVQGRAQVSMNLTDYHQTPIARVVEFVRREAARYGVTIHHSELIGMAPLQAFSDAAAWYTQLDAFTQDQILEHRLLEVQNQQLQQSSSILPAAFLSALASGDPTPGGGAAAALSAAMGAALVAMVARLTIGKKKYAEVDERMQDLAQEAESLRLVLTDKITEDSQSFDGYMQALHLPKGTEEEQAARKQALAAAALNAAEVPLEVARRCIQVLKLAGEVIEKGNLSAISDGASACYLAMAALGAAALNVRENAATASEAQPLEPLLSELQGLEAEARRLFELNAQAFRSRSGLPMEVIH